MQYNDFKGTKVSAVAFGAMRLPVLNDDEGKPNPGAVQELVDLCYSAGINYYDTAWGYHNGKSQVVLCDALRRYDRDSYLLANKFPGYDLSNMPHAAEIFEQQLKLCKVDYFDFYLIHNVCDLNINQYLDPKYGIREYFAEQVRNGRIRHLGFSLHGGMDVLKRFSDYYGEFMEFCQLQINYVDWEFQDAREKTEFCRARGWPVIVMEPLRGGRIAKMSDEQLSKLNAVGEPRKPVEWAFDFLQSIPGVLTTLTGMSQVGQAQEKIGYYDDPRPLSEKEFDAVVEYGRELTRRTSVPCTACRYCTSHCPRGLDIPLLIARYNEMRYNCDGPEFVTSMAMAAMSEDKKPTACIGCGKCAKVCPQMIDIPEVMKGFAKELKERAMF